MGFLMLGTHILSQIPSIVSTELLRLALLDARCWRPRIEGHYLERLQHEAQTENLRRELARRDTIGDEP